MWEVDIEKVLKERYKKLVKVRKSKQIYSASLMYYKTNAVAFIESWMFTHDPRRQPAFMPFILWKKQREYINWLWERFQAKEDGLVEKSRDAGATWLNMAFAIWLWRFHSGVKIGFGSRKQDLVDRIGDPDSIFEKGRMILRSLPKEYLPYRFNEQRDLNFLKFVNPENGSAITGEAGDNIGRGGRSSIYIKDESAFYERPLLIDSALSQNSDVKIDVSTPNGMGNPFYSKRFSGKIDLFIFDWKDDPRKTQGWYDKQVDTLDPIILAQEVNRDYGASLEDVCIPAKYVQAVVNSNIPDIDSGMYFSGLDVADEGADANALVVRKGNRVILIRSWKIGNTTETTRKAVNICKRWKNISFRYDPIGVGAGVKGECKSLRFPADPINAGASPTPGLFEPNRKNKDMFSNLKAQMWWEMRRRFERTYEHVNGIKKHPLDNLISLPDNKELAAELSQPKYMFTETGKLKIESKERMRTRGIASPNLADALMICFAPNTRMKAGALR